MQAISREREVDLFLQDRRSKNERALLIPAPPSAERQPVCCATENPPNRRASRPQPLTSTSFNSVVCVDQEINGRVLKRVALHHSYFVQRFLSRPTALVGKERPARHICLLHQQSNIESVDALIPIDLDVASVAKQGRSTRVSTARGCVWLAGE